MKFMRFPEAKAINRSTSSRFAISEALRIIVGRGSFEMRSREMSSRGRLDSFRGVKIN